MATYQRTSGRLNFKVVSGPLPHLLPPKHQPTKDGQHEDNAPRRLTSIFTQSHEALQPVDTQAELLSALVPLTKLIANSKATTSPASADAVLTTLSPTQSKPKRKKRIRPKTERRREQCRNNQARYRDRQRGFVRELEESVNDLQEEIQQLNKERHTLRYGIQTKSNVWNVVVEYFRLFRYGFLMPIYGTGSSGVSDLHDQEYFLRAVMASDVAFGELTGVDPLIDQWQRYSFCFGNLFFQLNRMEQQPLGAMLASATLSLTITEATLRYVFPHLLGQTNDEITSDEEDGYKAASYRPLCSQLLGQRLDCRVSVYFSWDDTAGRVTRLACKMDFLTPLLQVQGNLEDVSYVLEQARMTPEYLICDSDSKI